MEHSVNAAREERDNLSMELKELREKASERMTENSQVEAVNCELEFEVERMTDYAKALQESLENIGKDYTEQFEGYLDRIRSGE